MSFRILSAALLLGALAVTSSTVQASGGGDQEQCETRECELKFFNPPILKVSECIEINCLSAKILVITNCHTIVRVDCDDAFKRFERDLDCKQLKTFDTIPARCSVTFVEAPQCQDGGQFNVKKVANETWKVESHRGGYWIVLACAPFGREACDDCGCYELDCTVQVCTLPCEEEADCCVVICD